MTRLSLALPFAALALLSACNVTDHGNGSSTISIDENKVEQGTDTLANEAAKAGDQAANALRNAGPEIEKSASEIQERAGRVANKIDNVDIDVDLNAADDKPARPAN